MSPNVVVSIIVCTYNQEHTISRTLDSIINQKTDYPYEVIIGEDCSTDSTRYICENYCNKYSFIHLMPSAPNKGILLNYSDCLDVCNGEFIMGCAGDDWWHNDAKIQLQVDFLLHNTNYVLVYGGCIVLNENGMKKQCYPSGINGDVYSNLLQDNFIMSLTTCFRKSVLRFVDFNIFKAQNFTIEDYPLYLTMSLYGKFYCYNKLFCTYTIHNGSISNCSTIEKKEQFEYQVYNTRMFFLRTYPTLLVTEDLLSDKLYLALSTNGIRYNNKSYCMQNILKIKHKKFSDYVKLFLCHIPFGFNYMRKLIGVIKL